MTDVRERLSLVGMSNIIRGTQEHKSAGTNGVKGWLYKLHTGTLAPVFLKPLVICALHLFMFHRL